MLACRSTNICGVKVSGWPEGDVAQKLFFAAFWRWLLGGGGGLAIDTATRGDGMLQLDGGRVAGIDLGSDRESWTVRAQERRQTAVAPTLVGSEISYKEPHDNGFGKYEGAYTRYRDRSRDCGCHSW